MSDKLKNIAVSKPNYSTLKSLGEAGDSFNDVITKLLKKSSATKSKEESY